MENGVLSKSVRADWLPANPWLWTSLGLAICLANLAAVLMFGRSLNALGAGCLFLGLLFTAAGVIIRLNSTAPSFLDRLAPEARFLVLLGLWFVFALIATAATALVFLHVCGVRPTGWRLSGLVIVWAVVCPLCVTAMVVCGRRARPNCHLSAQEEGAATLIVAALAIFGAIWALYNPESPDDWSSLRLFLSVLFLVTLGSAPLLLVSQTVRRVAVSVLILLHFAAISSAIMTPAPSSWLFRQLWGRVCQPYLEFMYLNNAYHFYAPEPGPASFAWFRLFFEDSNGQVYGHWLKIPDLDERGWHKNNLSLEYQRTLSVTENIIAAEPMPSQYLVDREGAYYLAPWFADRLAHSPNQPVMNIGQREKKTTGLVIPFHPVISPPMQFLQPNEQSRLLLSSYAKHVCRIPHPTHPDYKIKSVKIYRVQHDFVDMSPIGPFVEDGMDPRHPATYKPYYLGEYDPEGRLLDISQFDLQGNLIKAGDPFLFWLLPMLPDDPGDLNGYMAKSRIKSWVAVHAGDPDCYYTYDETEKRHLLKEEKEALKGR
jgi:hypothetical protein